ncbi:MAG: ABC transporter ATP-binding protein [Candidatus Glassbacteria bacterium]
MIVVQARHLSKRYGELLAVDHIDFVIEKGECFGFLGPNGAGKTTTMRMISCMFAPTTGDLRVFGSDVTSDGKNIRRKLGVVPQEDNLDIELTTWENLLVYSRYFDIPKHTARERIGSLLEFFQLEDRSNDKVDKLSGGMKRRLLIARALVNEPDVLILDEPTTGLDPQARHLVWEKLKKLRSGGITLIITTHYMEEAEKLCDRLVVMDGGRIIEHGAPWELVEKHLTKEVLELSTNGLDVEELLDSIGQAVVSHERLEETLLLFTQDGEELLHRLRSEKIPVSRALIRRSTLEDVFLKLTGRRLIE